MTLDFLTTQNPGSASTSAASFGTNLIFSLCTNPEEDIVIVYSEKMYLSRLAYQQGRSIRSFKVTSSWMRSFATNPKDGDEVSSGKNESSSQMVEAQSFLDATARGVGQVIFLNSTTSGAVVFGGLMIGSPYLASLAALGAVTATATAKASGLDDQALKDGLWGYNGALVGCAAAVFGPSSVLAASSSTLLGSAASPFVAASLKETMSIPQWTYAFNAIALTSLLRTRPFLPTEEVTTDATDSVAAVAPGFSDLLVSPFVGISQIFVVESAMSGLAICYGIGMYSPALAGHAVMGSALGSVVGAFSGADMSELAMGLWGFNSALTSMAVGVFFVNSTPAIALSAGGAIGTAAVFGAMKTVFGAYGAPCLTLPFCTTMSACYLLQKHVPGLQLASSPHSPEKNKV